MIQQTQGTRELCSGRSTSCTIDPMYTGNFETLTDHWSCFLMEMSYLLPVRHVGNKFEWVSGIDKLLSTLSRGPVVSSVQSGEKLLDCILSLHHRIDVWNDGLDEPSTSKSLGLFFRERVSEASSERFFHSTLPSIAQLALRLPDLLEQQRKVGNVETRLRVLRSQEPGIVFLSQELAASLLACSFLCLHPTEREPELPAANFNGFFSYMEAPSQQQKMLCMLNYFERVCEDMPQGMVSYERKVLFPRHRDTNHSLRLLPDASFWRSSRKHLCKLEVVEDGSIETHQGEALEVDFANKYLGGGTLRAGCVQEEIRFMINPELIAGMFFLPKMEDNEAIEICGAERFSSYKGYGKGFCFAGDYSDHTQRDHLGRRMTRIVAIDALARPGLKQFESKLILREVNKAYCGFLDQDKEMEKVGIATGNWGCGAFGGDVELKSMIQWIAASQAGRPFVQYYTFKDPRAMHLQETADWIASRSWHTGDLWSLLLRYGHLRQAGRVDCGFFEWTRSLTGIQTLLFKFRTFISLLVS